MKLTNEASIILTHIGKGEFPYYIYDCVEQIRLFNPATKLYLAIDKEAKNVDYSRLYFYRVEIVFINDLIKTDNHKLFSRKTWLSKFWKVTMERFFIVEEVMRKYDINNAIHLENDNLIYFSVEELFPKVTHGFNTITMPRDNEERCIAGIVFIQGVEAVSKINEHFVDYQHLKTNEMILLGLFMKNNEYKTLPVVGENMSCIWRIEGSKMKEFSYRANELNGVFDAAALGQLIGGKDKRQYKDIMNGNFSNLPVGIEPFINPDAVYEYQLDTIKWIKNDRNLMIPVIQGQSNYYIYNLHIHSKELYRFKSNSISACSIN